MNPDAVGMINGPFERSWTETDSIIYALGVGAGHNELQFTTENSEGITLKALPTMAVVLDTSVLTTMLWAGEFDVSQILHGEQRVELHAPLPAQGTLRSRVEITGIYDKGEHALVVCQSIASDQHNGTPLYTTTWTGFIRGAGGFDGGRRTNGSQPAPSTRAPLPNRPADHQVTYVTGANQGLLYRLSGDRHPLHSDPAYGARLGFERPILHGLCTYGFTGRALLDALCGNDPARLRSIDARFAAPVLPGETLTIEIWRIEDTLARFQTLGADGRVVLSDGRCAFS
jgi:acyl dehydratase